MRTPLRDLLMEAKPSKIVPDEIGIFAARDIKAGEFVCKFSDIEEDFISNEEFSQLSPALQEKIERFTGGTPEGYLIEAGMDFNELPISYYFNHSCEGNLGYNAQYQFIALRDIQKGEELTYDYGIAETNPEYAFDCMCGAATCRGRVCGMDWQDPAFKAKKGAYFYPDLR
jgi:hypothetical protein